LGNELYGDDGFRGQIKEYTKNPGSLPLLTGVISNWTKIFTVIASEEKQSQSLRLLHFTSFEALSNTGGTLHQAGKTHIPHPQLSQIKKAMKVVHSN
jgi:hypothetical protein